MDPDADVIHVDSDHGESEDDDVCETSTSGEDLFSGFQVFIVRAIVRASTGFRPSVMCEGYLAELSKSSSGYILSPLGRDQQLSFKYEPPSPKFSRKRPSCVSYRLQLLHGSQFLYSLRGLPKALRFQRSAHALEWGHVHLVFSAASDLDTFLTTLKYVEVEEMVPEAERAQQGSTEAEAHRQSSGAGDAATAASAPGPGASAAGGGRGRMSSIGGTGMQWAVATARLLAAESAGISADAPAAAAGAPAAAPVGGGRLGLLDWVRPLDLGAPLPLMTAAAVLAAAAAVAVFLLRPTGGSGRRSGA